MSEDGSEPVRERSASLRVSDQDRDGVIAQLNRHAGEGRLTLEELEERVEQAFNARTRGELEPLTRDLPTAPGQAAPGQAAARQEAAGQEAAGQEAAAPEARRAQPARWDVAIMGGNNRRGRFRLRDRFHALAFMGGSDIDLRNAVIDGDEVTILAVSIMGGSTIYVPDSVEVEVNGFALLGGNDEKGSAREPRANAPVIRIQSYALMGGVDVWRLPAETRGMPLKQARRTARALERQNRHGGSRDRIEERAADRRAHLEERAEDRRAQFEERIADRRARMEQRRTRRRGG